MLIWLATSIVFSRAEIRGDRYQKIQKNCVSSGRGDKALVSTCHANVLAVCLIYVAPLFYVSRALPRSCMKLSF